MNQYLTIENGSYKATVRSKGASLASLTYKGRNLVDPLKEDDARNLFWGDVLAPWPNRIRDGKYGYRNKEYILHINEEERSNALHGLVFDSIWNIQESKPSYISLSTTITSSKQYPADIQLVVSYQISDMGLIWTVTAKNIGNSFGPYGVSVHPYLIADPVYRIDDCQLKVPSLEFMDVDMKRLLPTGIKAVHNEFDFNELKLIGKTFIDHAFLIDPSNLSQRVELIAPSGLGTFMEYSQDMKWIQIHTADRSGGAGSRTCLAVEPMTCPPDAFNSGIDLIDLGPGQSHTSSWRIAAIK